MRDIAEERRRCRVLGGGAIVFLLVAFPLLREFWEPGNLGWNSFLVIFLIAVVAAALLLQRYFMAHMGEIGEARFDTSNKSDRND